MGIVNAKNLTFECALYADRVNFVGLWYGHKGRGEYFKGKTDCRNGISEP